MVSKIEPYSERWQREAGALARGFCPPIYPCGKCSHPVVRGYCCTFCGSTHPEDDHLATLPPAEEGNDDERR
jgi:hypothetical protein